MYDERNCALRQMQGDATDRQHRQIIKMLEDIRTEVQFLRKQAEKENR